MECCKRVGVEGGRLQLDSFGIELEIPPGAIDSEVRQDISLRVLTDTPNLGNSKEEMSVCFGVQCLAPDDLVLKLPVTYTMPHCAVITRYSSVEAVLYTGEGEYSPDAEVKEEILLTQSGIPNCNIERDKLRLQINHFSWAFICFKMNVFFRAKRMYCLPFAETPLPDERIVVLRVHLYDDVEGIKEIISQEEGKGFARVHPEAEVLINVQEVDVIITCLIGHDPIGDSTVKYDELCRGHHIMKSFILDLSSQPDERIIVTLKVGQTGQPLEEMLCIFKFTTPTSFPTQDLEQLQGASSSQTLQASHRRKGGILENISGRQEDFDEKMTTVARKVGKRDEIDNLGKALGFDPEDIQHYVDTNMKNSEVSYMGTLSMLRKWRKKQTEATECEALNGVLRKAGQQYLAFELFEQLQTASSSQKQRTSHRNTGEIPENISGRQEDFDEKLTTVARKVGRRDEIDKLGKALGFDPEDIQRYVDTNMKNSEVSYMGTLLMLRYWRKKQTEATECEALKGVLKKAGQQHLAFELFDDLVGATAKVQVHEEQTDTHNTEEEEKKEDEGNVEEKEEEKEEGEGEEEEEEEEENEEEEEKEEEEDEIATGGLPHKTDEVNVKPIKMECCKRVGVEGGTLQLDSFGIELEIPPGAIESELLQDISLSVLTDTPNLGNSKEEMSFCFGVQCLAPDDLVLKLPVTYTIPHCAVITRYSSVEAVLYTGEGEYSPGAEVKERIPLTQSGIPNFNITRDILTLQMNHFSWAFIIFKLNNFLLGGRRMRCQPFAEKSLPEERTHVILRAHLYDDIEGNNMKIMSQEEGLGFAYIHPEAEVLISAAEVDVNMTCFIDSVPIKDATVKYDELLRGHHRIKSFDLDMSSQPGETIVVTLQVGQTGQSLGELLCKFKFTTPRRSTSVLTHDLEQLQGASSSHAVQTLHRSTNATQDISGKREDFDKKMKADAQRVVKHEEMDNLGNSLIFERVHILRYIYTHINNEEVSCWGALSMFRDWRKKQTKTIVREALKDVLEKGGQIHLADELFEQLQDASSSQTVQTSQPSTGETQDTSQLMMKEILTDIFLLRLSKKINLVNVPAVNFSIYLGFSAADGTAAAMAANVALNPQSAFNTLLSKFVMTNGRKSKSALNLRKRFLENKMKDCADVIEAELESFGIPVPSGEETLVGTPAFIPSSTGGTTGEGAEPLVGL